MLATQRILILAIALAGPALALYMAGDRLFDEPWPFRFLHGLPWLFYIAAVVSFTAAMTLARPGLGYARSAIAVAVAIVLVVLGFAASWPMLFGLSEMRGDKTAPFLVLVCITLTPAALAHHFILRSGAPAIAELPAHVAAMAGPILILGIFSAAAQTQLYAAWPAIVAAVPLAVVAMAYTKRSPVLGRAAIAALISIAPIYLVKAWSDGAAGRGNPFAWPARIAREFTTPAERSALIRRATLIRKGQPVRIGRHWYAFERFGFQNAHPNDAPHPDRIKFLQLDVPAEDLGLLGKGWGSRPDDIQLNIGVAQSHDRARLKSAEPYITGFYEDLRITIVQNLNRPSLDDVVAWPSVPDVQERLSRYMQAHRVPEPVAAPPDAERP